ncbi:unnamed protein product, partial [Rotaria sp. Silwood1]
DRSLSDVSSQQAVQEHTVLRQMTPEQIAKLRSELDVVQTNVQVFGEMLVTLQPGEEHPLDLDLLLVKIFYYNFQDLINLSDSLDRIDN